MTDIRVRIAPSPTGLLHIGTVRTALFNYLFAKHYNGTYIIRVEDTDKERSTIEFEKDIIEGLEKLGLHADESPLHPGDKGPYRQSERVSLHQHYVRELMDAGHAYYCFCSKDHLEKQKQTAEKEGKAFHYPGTCRNISSEEAELRIRKGEKAVIRFRLPGNSIEYNDIIRGKQEFRPEHFDDFIVAKDLETPLYNFGVVVDDHLMEISHVIRGEDHISNTPKQIWLYQAFGWTVPQFAHLPLILNEDRTKLSKRKNKVSVNDYLKEGYLSEALINFLALLGWNTADEQEIFSMEELVEKFDLDRVQKAGAVFDLKRLQWINGIYIRQFSSEDLFQRVLPYWREMPWFDTNASEEFLMNIIQLLQDRLTTLSDITLYTQYFFVLPVYEKELLIGKKMDAEMAKTAITKTIELLQSTDDFSEEHLKEVLIELRDKLEFNTGQLLWPVRAALSGEPASPGAFELLSVFGKEESLKRLSAGLAKL